MVRAWGLGVRDTNIQSRLLSVFSEALSLGSYLLGVDFFMYKMGIKMLTCRIVVKN